MSTVHVAGPEILLEHGLVLKMCVFKLCIKYIKCESKDKIKLQKEAIKVSTKGYQIDRILEKKGMTMSKKRKKETKKRKIMKEAAKKFSNNCRASVASFAIFSKTFLGQNLTVLFSLSLKRLNFSRFILSCRLAWLNLIFNLIDFQFNRFHFVENFKHLFCYFMLSLCYNPRPLL